MKSIIKIIAVLITGVMAFASCQKKPMACCDVPVSGAVGQPINFNSTCSMDASKYEWNFGDGQTSTDANPTHIYSDTGTFSVKLMAMSKNDKYMDETSKSITIK